jgi:hypothetical protein
MKIRNVLRKLNDAMRPPQVGALQPQGEGRRLVDAEERQWVEYMPSQQDDRPPR